jgi:hypothetical protein
VLTVRVEVEVPPEDRARLEGLVEADRLTDDVVVVNVIVPENPPRLVMVIVELPLVPRERLRLDGLAVMEKSRTPTVIATV